MNPNPTDAHNVNYQNNVHIFYAKL